MTHLIDQTPSYLLIIAALNLALAAYIFFRNRQATMNRSFAFFASSLSLWTAALAFGLLYPAYYIPTLQLAFATGSLSAMGVVMFVEALPVPYISQTHRSLWVFGFGAIVLSILFKRSTGHFILCSRCILWLVLYTSHEYFGRSIGPRQVSVRSKSDTYFSRS